MLAANSTGVSSSGALRISRECTRSGYRARVFQFLDAVPIQPNFHQHQFGVLRCLGRGVRLVEAALPRALAVVRARPAGDRGRQRDRVELRVRSQRLKKQRRKR